MDGQTSSHGIVRAMHTRGEIKTGAVRNCSEPEIEQNQPKETYQHY